MKIRLLTLVLLLCTTLITQAQYVTIPDANFLLWLNNNGFSQCLVGNQMDTTCQAVVNPSIIICNNKSISNLTGVQYFDALSQLNCDNNSLTWLPPLPATLNLLSCGNNHITALPTLPPNLRAISCDENNLTALPSLPSTLLSIDCSDNSITALPVLPPNLNKLDCSGNPISSIPTPPSSIRDLDYGGTNITTYVPVPDSLMYLNISSNAIDTIPFLPSKLIRFFARGCDLRNLPQLPPNLLWLYCDNNELDTLPPLPNTITTLVVSDNHLTWLPTLPLAINTLGASRNDLDSLPALPMGIRSVSCDFNNLISLPVIPPSVSFLYCMSNHNLSYIPNLPDSLEYLSVDSTSVVCLPPFRVANTFRYVNTPLSCLPNYPIVQYSNPPLSNLSICVPNNAAGCVALSNLSGITYIDENVNCALDNYERGQQNMKYSLWKEGVLQQQMIAGSEGLYSFDVEPVGNYSITIDTANLPYFASCPASGELHDTLSLNDSIHYNRNFALRCDTGFDVTTRSILAFDDFRPASINRVNVHAGDMANFFGGRCAFGISGTVRVTISGPATYMSPALGATIPSNVNNNVITWNVADFGNTNAMADFNILTLVDTSAQIGDLVCFKVSITPTAGDNNVSNNALTQCFKVVASYDPNDKTAYPSGDIDTAQEWLTYRVRFQNTGNAEAQHIYIMDTLDTDVDASTFELLAYSHQPNVQINEQIVRFNFPNINLPDSFTNEPGSHGYVQYKVKLKENLPIGTTIQNTAYIYFDFNPPVVTNTTANTIALVQDTTGVGIKQVNAPSLNIYPNPANGNVTVTTSQPGHIIYMYTAQGQLLSTQAMQGTAATLNIDALPSGIYYIEVSGSKGIARKKLVKL